MQCDLELKAKKKGLKIETPKVHENTEMDFDLDNNRSSIMVGIIS
jgi:hypothetical protein